MKLRLRDSKGVFLDEGIPKGMIGKKFNRLKILEFVSKKGPHSFWKCLCECGSTKERVSIAHLKSGHTKSCGCVSREVLIKRNTTHGRSSSRIYRLWASMIRRCGVGTSTSYRWYGARGIKVCNRWKTFENFYKDVGDPPRGMTMDRINNDGDYESGNFRWATPKQQANNRRKRGSRMKKVMLVCSMLISGMWINSQAVENKLPKQTMDKFYIYNERGSSDSHFIPSGYMGDYSDIKMIPAYEKNPGAGKTCIRVEYSAERKQGAGWAGVYWQSPANNWGNKKGGFDLTGYKKLTFMAKGEKGGEMIDKFGFGGIVGEKEDGDTDGAELFSIELKKQWTKYEIDLKGLDMSHIIGGFLWAANGDSNPEGAVFYLDEIVFVK